MERALDERDALERKLAAASVQYKRRSAGKQAGFKEISAALPDDTVLVSFIRFGHLSKGSIKEPEEYAAFVLSRGVPAVANKPPLYASILSALFPASTARNKPRKLSQIGLGL